MSPVRSQLSVPSAYTNLHYTATIAVALTLLLLAAACGQQAPSPQQDASVDSSAQTRPENHAAPPPSVRVTPEQMDATFEFDDPAPTAPPSAVMASASSAAGAAGPPTADDAAVTDEPAEPAELSGTEPVDSLPRDGDVAPPDSGKATAYDPMYTVQAMNHFVVALSNVIAAQDRIVMDQEYDNIINNYAWGNIESDPEMMSLVERTMEFITLKKLTEEERQRFYAAYEKQRGRALWNAVGGVRAYGANPLSFFLSLAQNSVSAYFRYRDVKSEMAGELDEQLWSLHEAEVRDLDEMRRTMVTTVWPILRQYALPDGQRLSEANVSAYLGARDDPDTARSLREYARLAPQFQAYPPFWHDYALRAQEANDAELAIKCYNTFLQMHRDVLRKDPYLASVCLNKALILVGSDGDPSEVRTLADRSAAHLGRDDGASRLALAYVYTQLGDQEAARRQLQVNIDYGQDVSASKIAAWNLDEGRPLHSGIPALIALVAAGGAEPELPDDPAELLALAEQGAPEAQFHLWQTDREGGDRWLEAAAAQGYPPAVLESAVGDLFGDDPEAALSSLKGLSESGEPEAYYVLGYYYAHILQVPEWSTAAQYYERSSNEGHIDAMFELGALLLNEENPNRDASRARKWWTSAAKAGHVGAQRELGQRLLWRGGFDRDEENEAQKQADAVEGFEWIKRAAEQGDNQAVPELYYCAFTPGPPSVCNARNQGYARSLLEKYDGPVDSWLAYLNGELLALGDGLVEPGLVLLERCVSDGGEYAPDALADMHAVRMQWNERDFYNTAFPWHRGADWEANARKVHQLEPDERILYAWDDTWLDTYGKGFCVTTKRICTTAHGSSTSVSLDEIGSASVGAHEGSQWILADDRLVYKVKQFNAECVPFIQELLELRKRMTMASDLE